MKIQPKFLPFIVLTMASATGMAQYIYKPTDALGDQKMRLYPWGSGTIAETNELVYDGTRSIRISTRNFYQGGSMLFTVPRDLSTFAADPSNMLMLTLQAPTLNLTMSAEKDSGGVKTTKTNNRSSLDDSTNPGALKRVEIYFKENLGKVRCIITTADDLRSEVYFDLSSATTDTRGWKTIGIPLGAIAGFERTNKQIKSMSFSGDTYSSFYIGEIKITSDRTPIYIEPNVREMNLALGDTIELIGYGTAGSTMLKYTWDFDDKDGIQVDTEGQAILRRFMKPGNYTVTVTAQDEYGLKKPASTTIKIVVNP